MDYEPDIEDPLLMSSDEVWKLRVKEKNMIPSLSEVLMPSEDIKQEAARKLNFAHSDVMSKDDIIKEDDPVWVEGEHS